MIKKANYKNKEYMTKEQVKELNDNINMTVFELWYDPRVSGDFSLDSIYETMEVVDLEGTSEEIEEATEIIIVKLNEYINYFKSMYARKCKPGQERKYIERHYQLLAKFDNNNAKYWIANKETPFNEILA